MRTPSRAVRPNKHWVLPRHNTTIHDGFVDETYHRISDHLTRKALANFFCEFERADNSGGIRPHSFSCSEKDGHHLVTIRAQKKQQKLIAFVRGSNAREALVNAAFALCHGWLRWRQDKGWAKR